MSDNDGWPPRDWEKEHGSDRDDGHHYDGVSAIQPYIGDPVCTEYERLCAVGADILKGMTPFVPAQVGDVDPFRPAFERELTDMWRRWCDRVKEIDEEVNPVPSEPGTPPELDDLDDDPLSGGDQL